MFKVHTFITDNSYTNKELHAEQESWYLERKKMGKYVISACRITCTDTVKCTYCLYFVIIYGAYVL